MSLLNTVSAYNSGLIGDKVSKMLGFSTTGEEGLTPLSSDIIPTATVTKGMKLFSSQSTLPNIPKPRTLYFVHFSINSNINDQVELKNQLIQMLSGSVEDASNSNVNEVNNELQKKSNSSKEKEITFERGATKENSNLESLNTNKSKSSQSSSPVTSDYYDKLLTVERIRYLAYEISKMVKKYDKPTVKFGVDSLNEYNRKRIVYKDVKYEPVTVTFYDVKESPVQEFFINYLKYINSDFLCKNSNTWEAPIDNNHWMRAKGYYDISSGKQVAGTYIGNANQFGYTIDSNFRMIDKISFCEYYQDRMTVYTIENPVITDIKFGSGEMGKFDSNEITVTFEYEGITNDLINVSPYNVNFDGDTNSIVYLKSMVNAKITKSMATFLQTKYTTNGGSASTDLANILKGYLNGEKKFTWNNIKNNALDMARKYGYATEVNNAVQLSNDIKTYQEKEGSDKWKFLINNVTDPTSLVGKTSKAVSSSNVKEPTQISSFFS